MPPSWKPPSWRPPSWRSRGTASASADEDDDGFFTVDLDPEDYGAASESDDEDSPWEGALVYRRDAAVHHLEHATTLERLGLGGLSSPDSRARAAAMGMGPPDQPHTPVLVSLDVTRRRARLRLDGIVRTVITLGCFRFALPVFLLSCSLNIDDDILALLPSTCCKMFLLLLLLLPPRCAEPAPQGIFANFSLLLTEDPVEEPDVVDLGTVFYDEDAATGASSSALDEDDQDVDWDDRLHFPAGDREIDISKNIRDIVHLEITMDAVCSPSCKGLCLACGENLNTSSGGCACACSKERQRGPNSVKGPGPLKELLKPIQKR
jgi:hypothetical protein